MTNKKLPSFSIIIPHHNSPDLLQRCIDSIPQSNDIQVIVVDDNSDPDVVDFDNFPGKKRENVRVFLTKEGKGAGYARNVGLKYAVGKWLIFSDADDFFDSKALLSALHKYRDSSWDVVVFPIRVVDSDTLIEGNWRDEYFNKVFYSNEDTRIKLIKTVSIWSRFIKRDLVERDSISFEEIRYANDQQFSVRVALSAKQILFEDTLKVYNLTYSANSLTRSKDLQAFKCRFESELRFWDTLKRSNIIFERYTYRRFLGWASEFGLKKVFTTYRKLRKSQIPYFPKGIYKNHFVYFVRVCISAILKKLSNLK